MDIAIALSLAFLLLLAAVQQGIFILYPLMVSLGLLTAVYRHRGMPWSQLLRLMGQGIKQSTGVISILLLIGMVVASWLIAGTVPTLVYYGIKMLHPRWFLLGAFGLTGGISVLLGTSFGAAGTIGLALMIVARGAGVDEAWAAGAIMAGAYVGDRCSPLSSSAHLVAAVTTTDIYQNLRHMVVTSWGALLVSSLIYGGVSWWHPVPLADRSLLQTIPAEFSIQPLTLLPAAVVVGLTLMRWPVKRTLFISLACGIAIALTLQARSVPTVISTLLLGLHLPEASGLKTLFQGGGLWGMAKVCSVVVVSTAFSGLLSGGGAFHSLGQRLSNWPGQRGLFGGSIVASILTSAFGCSQTLAILLTHKIMQPIYQTADASAEQLAVDMENSAVVIAPLIPWNIASFGPASILLMDGTFIPYALYLYILPLWNWGWRSPLPQPCPKQP